MKATIYTHDGCGNVVETISTEIASDHSESTLMTALAPSVGGFFDKGKVYHIHLATLDDRLVLNYVIENGSIVFPPKRK